MNGQLAFHAVEKVKEKGEGGTCGITDMVGQKGEKPREESSKEKRIINSLNHGRDVTSRFCGGCGLELVLLVFQWPLLG